MPTHPLKLILCIALGVWLGCVAVVATGVFAYDALIASKVSAMSAAVDKFKLHVPGMHKSQAMPDANREPEPEQQQSDNPMFEKYKQNLLDTQARQENDEANAAREKRISGPKCQFWLQQDQTAPSEKTRTNVSQFCG